MSRPRVLEDRARRQLQSLRANYESNADSLCYGKLKLTGEITAPRFNLSLRSLREYVLQFRKVSQGFPPSTLSSDNDYVFLAEALDCLREHMLITLGTRFNTELVGALKVMENVESVLARLTLLLAEVSFIEFNGMSVQPTGVDEAAEVSELRVCMVKTLISGMQVMKVPAEADKSWQQSCSTLQALAVMVPKLDVDAAPFLWIKSAAQPWTSDPLTQHISESVLK